ncbi:unnamed protein product [Phytophthora lilii]|uniref:Elongator complex protein 5 n=1 Tax=Phytophthora lilii TaxID=2077276 RepID=A0A9W6TI12_9STRA|nr:unnamed protein product [Phytophthora lilii]
MLRLTLQSARTSKVLLLSLDCPQVAQGVADSTKLEHIDYSANAANFQASALASQLLDKVMQDIERVEASVIPKAATSARPMVVVLDSLNVLLQQTSLQHVLLFLRRLRSHTPIGSVIARINAGAESHEVAQALAAQATALVLVETRASLRAYPLLAKERRREIRQGMHGLNGRSSESVEYFQGSSNSVAFMSTDDAEANAVVDNTSPKPNEVSTKKYIGAKKSDFKRKSQPDVKTASFPRTIEREASVQASLPVRQEEVSFNLSISDAEQKAKSKVQLPYTHQGSGKVSGAPNTGNGGVNAGAVASNNPLFFIDEDDPDWDDDDLDDDLVI